MSQSPKFVCAALLATLSVACLAQAVPTATAPSPYSGFSLPTVGGSLRYSLTASETVATGYNGGGGAGRGTNTYTTFGGNLAYLSHSEHNPFSAVYSAGYLVGNSSFPSYFYNGLSLSQVLSTRDWTFIVADNVEYTPQTPTGSLSGIPGAGDLTVAPVQVVNGPGLGLLTNYATRIGNTVSGTATDRLTGSTSMSFSGAYAIQRYTGATTGFGGIDNNQVSASASVQHRIDPRTSFGGIYQFTRSDFTYPLLGLGNNGFITHSVQGTYTRQLNRRTTLLLGAGPQWVVPGSSSKVVRKSSLGVAANAALNYTAKTYSSAISYTRGVSNGNGVVVGSVTDSLNATISRPFARIYQVGGIVGYNHSKQIDNSVLANYNSNGVVAGGQFSVQVYSPLSVFASYTLQRQFFNGVAPTGIAFNGLSQYLSFGVTYSPKAFLNRK